MNKPQILRFNLSLSLIAVNIIFLVGIKRTENRKACMAISGLLYYFLLTSFLWMLAEGILAFINFVRIFDSYTPNFIIIVSICNWRKYACSYPSLLHKISHLTYSSFTPCSYYCYHSSG